MDIKQFTLVEYNNISYPKRYVAYLQEIAGHLDKDKIEPTGAYSLHTEYSYGTRKFDSDLISKYPILCEAEKNGIPQLWYSEEWASAFADFIIELTAPCQAPTTIEIHPPFNDYCTVKEFTERFKVFEEKIHFTYPTVKIVIENRSGAMYRGGNSCLEKQKKSKAYVRPFKMSS